MSSQLQNQKQIITFGLYLRRLREHKDWSQRELARKLTEVGVKLSYNFVRRLEADKTESPRFTNVIALSKLFNVSVENFKKAYEGIDPDLFEQ
jgi:transcriptional regulator with XRE-family HTH domain